MAQDFGVLAANLKGLAKDLKGPPLSKALAEVGVGGKKDIDTAVTRDAGADLAMRNFRKRKPVKLGGKFDVVGPDEVVLKPRSPGGMAILSKRNGKGTWPAAGVLIDKNSPARIDAAVTKVITTRMG